ncbi:amidase [Aquibium sp. A9E412]|uniref:amidase n=1 Tax=Aquibium sp. A9E412 TaxID=2976767 RepID=UPI0025B084F9|nr:amidase [Aquibium sp. A9E412]MDN2567597.1 amidase [Aquibium sp. A9E412]
MTARAQAAADPALLSATALVDAYGAGTLSPVTATEAVLARVARLEPRLNAFCLVDREAALEQAHASEARWKAGAPRGRLDGVPVSIKDIVMTRGWPTLRGSRTIDPAQPWETDGPAVARLREDGAVLFGKTTTPEFAARPVTISPLTGVTRNPWDTTKTPGGSSGGAGAAVAAGLGPLALGTDAGGSIRIPASLCGVFGHKPSGGRVPMFPPTPYATLAAFGPMSRTVADAARMLTVIARPDDRDSAALPADGRDYEAALEDGTPARWRVAFSPTLGHADVDPEVAALVEAAVDRFAACGARIARVETVFDDPVGLLARLKRGLTAYAFRNHGAEALAAMDPYLVAEIEAARGAELFAHIDAEMERAAFAAGMARFHRDHDLLITPTLTVPAFAAEDDAPQGRGRYDWLAFTYPFNLTRQPAASVPCGFTAAGLPVGLQIVGRFADDLTVLQAARVFETIAPWADMRPNLETET